MPPINNHDLKVETLKSDVEKSATHDLACIRIHLYYFLAVPPKGIPHVAPLNGFEGEDERGQWTTSVILEDPIDRSELWATSLLGEGEPGQIKTSMLGGTIATGGKSMSHHMENDNDGALNKWTKVMSPVTMSEDGWIRLELANSLTCAPLRYWLSMSLNGWTTSMGNMSAHHIDDFLGIGKRNCRWTEAFKHQDGVAIPEQAYFLSREGVSPEYNDGQAPRSSCSMGKIHDGHSR